MSSKDPLAYERLYYKIQDLAKSIAINMFQGNDSVPDYTEAAVDAATNCLLDIARYNGESSFSTWAHSCISHDLLDWHKMEVDDRFASLNDDEHPIDVPDRHSSVDEKLFLKEVRSHLSPDELRLFEMLAENMTYEQIGKIEGFSISGVQYREELLHKKILALSRNPGG
jgi:RNA polymerase sigma factor (sigma-70 family)